MSKGLVIRLKVVLTIAVHFTLLAIASAAADAAVTQPGYRASLYETAWPADSANLNRSNTVVNAGLPRGVAAKDVAIDTVEMPFPTFAYTRKDDEVFVIGGTPLILARYVSQIDGLPVGINEAAPHITKYNPRTGRQVRLDLDRGTTAPYVGGAIVHANGFVYVISQSHLYRIEPESMTIDKSVDLPVAPGLLRQSTVYNGLATSSSGELITKHFSLVGNASKFLLIDPDSLAITAEVDYAGASPRLTVERLDNGEEYLYHVNQSETVRFRIEEGSLRLDEKWRSRYDPYQTRPKEIYKPASPVIVKGQAFYATNTVFSASEPMKIFWQDTEASYSPHARPLTGPDLFAGSTGPGWSFFHLTIDDDSGIIIGNDQGNGTLTAVRVSGDNSIETMWQKKLRGSARPAIVSDRGMVYCTDYVDGHNDLVVLDLYTGKELLRVTTPATRATISSIVASTNNEVYFGSNEPGKATGLFHRVYVPNPSRTWSTTKTPTGPAEANDPAGQADDTPSAPLRAVNR